MKQRTKLPEKLRLSKDPLDYLIGSWPARYRKRHLFRCFSSSQASVSSHSKRDFHLLLDQPSSSIKNHLLAKTQPLPHYTSHVEHSTPSKQSRSGVEVITDRQDKAHEQQSSQKCPQNVCSEVPKISALSSDLQSTKTLGRMAQIQGQSRSQTAALSPSALRRQNRTPQQRPATPGTGGLPALSRIRKMDSLPVTRQKQPQPGSTLNSQPTQQEVARMSTPPSPKAKLQVETWTFLSMSTKRRRPHQGSQRVAPRTIRRILRRWPATRLRL